MLAHYSLLYILTICNTN